MRIKWYVIKDHPNYELNRLGQVRNRRTGKILKPFDDRRGYLRVTLDGVNVKLHDPRASQLEWVTQSENIKHAWDTGLIKRS